MKKKLLFAAAGLILGLVCGFKVENYRFRREQAALAATSLAAPPRGEQAGQGQEVFAQVKALIDKARANPNDFAAQRDAAEQFMRVRRPEGALEFLLIANRLKPDDADTLASLSEASFSAQKYDDAIKWARAALRQKADYPLAMFYLMVSLVENKQNQAEAGQLLDKLEKIKPGDPVLAQVRQQLKGTPAPGPEKTTLSHGPEMKKP